MTELLPCPFCGGEADVTLSQGRYGQSYNIHHESIVKCPAAYVSMMNFTTEADAIAAWNTRAAYEIDGWFYLPKPKSEIGYTSETMVERTEHGYQMGAIAGVYENAVREWKKQLNQYIVERICDVFRPERTCRDTGENEWHFVCSACGYEQNGYETWNYCSNCGAKVVGE